MRPSGQLAEQFSKHFMHDAHNLRELDASVAGDEVLAAMDRSFMDRPSFLTEPELDRYSRDLEVCADVLMALPERLHGGVASAMAVAVGLPERNVDVIRAAEGLPRARFGRVDAIPTVNGLQVLEFNATSETGGLEWVDRVTRTWLGQPSAAAFLAERDCRPVIVTKLLADELAEFSVSCGGPRRPTVAIVEGPGGLAIYGHAWHPLRGLLEQAGLTTVVCELPEVSVRNDRAYVRGTPVDLIYRVFELSQVTATAEATAILLDLIRLAHAGDVAIWTSIDSEVLRNKTCLALLSSGRPSLDLTPAEAAAIGRLLPPTELLTAPADEARLAELGRRRAELILKPVEAFGGTGIVAGWEVPAERWESALRSLRGPAVLQQRVVPVREQLLDRDHRVRDQEFCYGIYYSPRHAFAGGAGRSWEYGATYVTEGMNSPKAKVSSIFVVPEGYS